MTVILFVAEYDSMRQEDETAYVPTTRLLECGGSARQEV